MVSFDRKSINFVKAGTPP